LSTKQTQPSSLVLVLNIGKVAIFITRSLINP